MQLGKATRIVLITRDFQRSLAFYRDTLGLELSGSVDREWACFNCGGITLCLCGYSPSMPYEPATLGAAPDQLLFSVADIEAAREELQRRGVEVGEVQPMSSTVRIAEFRDPDGRYLGLEQNEG